MKKITTKEIIAKYPKIFQDYVGNPGQCNWDVPDGWLPIIDTMCGAMQNYIDNVRRYSNGFSGPQSPPQVTCTQMKEKFGGLRFYTNGGDDEIEGMIKMAEYMCDNTCEVCGTHENLGYTTGWISVRCETCKGDSKWEAKKPINITTIKP